jgi:steroid 5-alpha reductase family enzyme
MLDLFLQAGLVIFILVTILWLISIFLKNVSIVDLFWGLGFVVVNGVFFYLKGEMFSRDILLLLLVSIWGLRLFGYLSWRNIGKPEDFRYQEFRRKYGVNRYWWISYFQTFILQGVLIMIVSLPLLGANYSTSNNELNWLDFIAIIIYIIGLTFETGGDIQLAKFKSNNANKGKVLNTGFWKYTRHPNYFGDSAVWWSFGLLSIAAGNYWTFVGSVVMTLLIIKVSGVALLEKTLKTDKPQYEEYITKTNAFFPWFPKK